VKRKSCKITLPYNVVNIDYLFKLHHDTISIHNKQSKHGREDQQTIYAHSKGDCFSLCYMWADVCICYVYIQHNQELWMMFMTYVVSCNHYLQSLLCLQNVPSLIHKESIIYLCLSQSHETKKILQFMTQHIFAVNIHWIW